MARHNGQFGVLAYLWFMNFIIAEFSAYFSFLADHNI